MKHKNIKRTAAICAAAAMLLHTGCAGKASGTRETVFGNVAIGGGGYIPGIVYSKAEEGLCYCRTDIGGAYRRSKSDSRWVPITDHFGGVNADDWNLIGIESIAADPVEPNRVYLSCGTYAGSNGAILSSSDYGNTWVQADMPFAMGGNMSGRGVGERLMVNPKDNRQVFCGSRTDGLYVSNDFGVTWEKCAAFPVEGDYFQEKCQIGVMWIEFDPVSNDMYVGCAMQNGECIYRSKDAGKSFEKLPANLAGMYPLQAEISPNGYLYLCYSDSCGPNAAVRDGAVCRYDLKSGKYEDITPDCKDGRYGGFSGLSVDGSNPDTVICSTLGFWSEKGENVYRSTDGGDTWTPLFSAEGDQYAMDTSEAFWLRWGGQQAKTGWWIADLEIDPFNSDRVTWGTGATLYTTQNMTELGSEYPVIVQFDARGIEETAVFKVVSVAKTDDTIPALYSIMGDLTGFAHLDTDRCPDDLHFMNNGTASDVAAAWAAGKIAAYTSDSKRSPLVFTNDGGSSWFPSPKLPERAAGGDVAVTADGSRIFWTPGVLAANVYYTTDFGNSWFKPNGLGRGAKIFADTFDSNTVYAVCDDSIYRSDDGGTNFASTGLTVSDNCELVPCHDNPDALWIRSGNSVGYSSDRGKTVNYLRGVSANAIGTGAPKNVGGVAPLYLMGEANGQGGGIYMTENHGKSWFRLTTDKDGFGNITPSITGDASVYGKFYFATNGRGIVTGQVQ